MLDGIDGKGGGVGGEEEEEQQQQEEEEEGEEEEEEHAGGGAGTGKNGLRKRKKLGADGEMEGGQDGAAGGVNGSSDGKDNGCVQERQGQSGFDRCLQYLPILIGLAAALALLFWEPEIRKLEGGRK
jgi:hypothetical protein